MTIVLINDMGVEVYKNWRQVAKETSFKKEDFTKIGNDYVLECDGETFEVSKDIKLLERVASERVFSKTGMDMSSLAVWATVILSLLIYMKL